MAQPWIHKGRVNPSVYIDKCVEARVPAGLYRKVYDAARANGGQRKNKESPPLHITEQVYIKTSRRGGKYAMLNKIINPKPARTHPVFSGSPFK